MDTVEAGEIRVGCIEKFSYNSFLSFLLYSCLIDLLTFSINLIISTGLVI